MQLRRAREAIEQLDERDYMVYTEGSADGGISDGRAEGCGDQERRGGQAVCGAGGASCSSFAAEAVAMQKALDCLERSREWSRAAVLMDSQALLAAMEDCSTQTRLSMLRDTLWRLEEGGRDLVLVWVRGHCDLPGNERADR